MKRLLLTGGNGFFCTRLTKTYQHTYDILSTDVPQLDITNRDQAMEAFHQFKPDYVLHAAAVASTDFCNNNPEIAHNINVKGAQHVAEAAKAVNAKMIFISTEQVFNGNTSPGPYREEDCPIPDTVYGQTKLEAEEKLRDILDELWVLRFTWLYGLPERNCGMSPNILWDTLSAVLKGEKIKVTSNEYRGLTYVYDVIDQIPKIFEIPYGTYHIGSQNHLSRYDVSKLILKEVGLEERIDHLLEMDLEKYKDHPRDARLSNEKIKTYGIGFADTKDSIKKCLEEFKLKI
ncbi:SDR family oxidoreductase [Geosporobacter ferrireducens]|uniref:dTDP-4-dehydrorhamnose reductase n=2 Tax=Geosporobacter ferrireducens TaxID=1424294 RepID=A0A1D8GDC5_9FIRM|nr:NAD(P)-dependent oxidoreductase [Geosporobacter ferrireducens]AOT68882.1 spore coat protein [Geosporobacter ferrireducens]